MLRAYESPTWPVLCSNPLSTGQSDVRSWCVGQPAVMGLSNGQCSQMLELTTCQEVLTQSPLSLVHMAGKQTEDVHLRSKRPLSWRGWGLGLAVFGEVWG